MEIIAHRINKIENLKKLDIKYGVEVDIRSDNKKLIIAHDPFTEYCDFEQWISFYNHGTLILNVKENGLEEKLLFMMKKFYIKNFFILDQSFPYLINTINLGEKICAIRLSEYESINTVISLKDKIKWVWIDFFTKFPLDLNLYNILKSNKFKLCIVSPELQGHDYKTCLNLRNYIKDNDMQFDAVCTKKFNLWED